MPFRQRRAKEVNDGASKKGRVTMARNGVLVANCYDHPQYYDIAFQAYTEREADFVEAACRKYCRFDVRRLLEPACGSGRLVTELARRGYQMTGVRSEPTSVVLPSTAT
jgi:2-polyprenyl-3-methyl-5-hydroxy-6-metoxy-1,4-benzoquinol methylase